MCIYYKSWSDSRVSSAQNSKHSVLCSSLQNGNGAKFPYISRKILLISVMRVPCEVPTMASEMWCRTILCTFTDVLVDLLSTFFEQKNTLLGRLRFSRNVDNLLPGYTV